MITSTVVVVIFYFICYFVPNLYVAFLKNNEEHSEKPLEGFHKLNAILFLFVLLAIVSLLILLFILTLIFTMATGGNIAFATSRYSTLLWNDGKMMKTWVSLALALLIGYSVLSLYFLLSPKDIQKKMVFRHKTKNDEDNTSNEDEDEDRQSTKIVYRMFLAFVLAIFLLVLALQSLYFSKDPIEKYSKALMYLLAISALFISLEWSFTIPIFIALIYIALAIEFRKTIAQHIKTKVYSQPY